MSVAWTEEQKQVISLRSRNILVSAAAGSGKTAVLVERIVSMVTDRQHPVDIDHLLIVTFTKAAAGEMRERIRNAIEQRLDENPENEHLQRQMSLIHNAQITTIDSFCQYVIRNHFHAIQLDPGFRVADEGELKLIKYDVAGKLLEEAYESKEEAFFRFAEYFATGKGDDELLDLILQIYHFSMSFPWPRVWIQECKKSYQVRNLDEFLSTAWIRGLEEQVDRMLGDMEGSLQEALKITEEPDGPYMYREALESDLSEIRMLKEAGSYLGYSKVFLSAVRSARLSSKRDPSVSEQKKEAVKEIRAQVKKSKEALQKQYFYADAEQLLEDMQQACPAASTLLDLTLAFIQAFQEKKKEKNLVDFSDLEHLALEILIDGEGEDAHPSRIAEEFADRYEEIMIDEYQDSNLVQEYILTSISRNRRGRNNVFMVGDVKQSIYRFRLARPELFMEKYASYRTEDSDSQRIELHRNFRSREQVLSGVNFIFSQIMASYLGNVEYDAQAALYAGASFPEGSSPEYAGTEVLLLDLDREAGTAEDSGENARELEARMIGARIRDMAGKDLVLDKKTGDYRPAQYRDMVILLRTVSGWADQMAAILTEMGIPAYTGSQSGYFSALEVRTVLSMLRIIDNPMQDIPLTAVLLSPIGEFREEELAAVRSAFPEHSFEEACRLYALQGKEPGVKEHLEAFYRQLDGFRSRVPYTAMHELLWQILDETGYGDYVLAMPGGSQRSANLDMLIQKAMAYESTSYRGLFHFVRYIENLQKYDVDFGEASVLGEEENTVRILSIHKSKGLEYPIVFTAGMAKSFNKQDSRSRLALHADLGIGCDWVDPVLRLKTPTLLKKMIQRQIVDENLGEELRVLYVALTRAKEKLILTGACSGIEKKLQKWNQASRGEGQKLNYTLLSSAASYLDWIMPALLRHPCTENLRIEYMLQGGPKKGLYGEEAEFSVRLFHPDAFAGEECIRRLTDQLSAGELLSWDPDRVWDSRVRERLHRQLEARYAYEESQAVPGQMTVSELKSKWQEREEAWKVYEESAVIPMIPRFRQKTEEKSGAARGSIYHRFLECLDYRHAEREEELSEQLEALVREEKLERGDAEVIDLTQIWRFVHSALGQRMKQAFQEHRLFREQPFMIQVPASEIREEWKTTEPVLIQGMIDAYFYEDGKIILVDYKTDYAEPGHTERLLDKYRPQLEYYGKALEQLTGIRVAEKLLYSFCLQKELRNQ